VAPPVRVKHLRLVRRDAQRLNCLLIGAAVPPSALLDKRWKASDRTAARLDELLQNGGVAAESHLFNMGTLP
jgi:hypothetical protein